MITVDRFSLTSLKYSFIPTPVKRAIITPAKRKRYPANSMGRGIISSPTLSRTKGDAHSTQHSVAKNVVDVINFFIGSFIVSGQNYKIRFIFVPNKRYFMKALSFIIPITLMCCACSSSTSNSCIPSYGFWEGHDFCDTTMIANNPSDVEKKFVEYINQIYYKEKDSLSTEFDKFIRYISSCPKSEEFFTELTEKYLYQYRSTPHIENMYLTFLERYTASPYIADENKIRPQMQMADIAKNTTGSIATDFTYTLPTGIKSQMHDIKTPLTLLYFNNPLCEECSATLEDMKNSTLLNDMIKNGEITVLSVYVDDQIQEWKDNLSHYPSNWIVAMDDGRVIDSERLYVLRIIPSIYLLGEDKEVILKNALWADVKKELSK